MREHTAKAATFIAVLPLLVGCAHDQDMGGQAVLARWSESIARYGMVPVVPPNEDLRVGDMFAHSSLWRAPSRCSPWARAGAPFPSRRRWQEDYDTRRAWPKTPDEYFALAEPEEERTTAEPEPADDFEIFADVQPTRRLRLVGFGTMSNVPFTEGDLETLIPAEIANLTNGTACGDRKVVRVGVSSAETYALRLDALLPLLVEGADAARFYLKGEYRPYLALLASGESGVVRLDVISEVVYARALDIAVQLRAASRADDTLYVSELDADEKGMPDEGVPEDTEPPPGEERAEVEEIEDHPLDPVFGAFARARAINEVLIESDTGDVPGGAVRVISATDESILIRRIFRRGIAIAARGLTLEVQPVTGEVPRHAARPGARPRRTCPSRKRHPRRNRDRGRRSGPL